MGEPTGGAAISEHGRAQELTSAARVPLPTGTVTFLFTDIEGSTRLLQELGAAYGAVLDDHRRLLRAAFTAHGGREVDTQGDSFFVAFASPAQAVAAAADAQRALAAHRWPEGRQVRVRMGLHTGEATEFAGGYVSLAVHRGARIAAVAHGGQVVLSDATAALVEDGLADGVSLRDLGEHSLKDFSRPVHLYQLELAGLPGEFPPLRTLFRHRHLPIPAGSFVGRDQDMEAVARLLRDESSRLVTLTGPGGIGKTRLALEAARAVARSFPGGVAFVPLAAVVDPGLVLSAVGDAVGARREPGIGILDAVSTAVGEHRKLLVLDNFEQVIGAAPDLAALLDRSPAVVALVTSRRVLRLRSEQEYQVAPLVHPATVRLFAERAAAVRTGFALTEANIGAVTEICRRLDGLPLAIELAAAGVRLLPPEALLARLDERLDVLGRGPVDVPERQRTLRATMDWSYSLLEPHEQAVLARLSVFAGGWTVEAAEAVCGRVGEPAVLNTLSDLLDKSLLVDADDSRPEPRLHMLETVRVYAAEKLAASPDRTETERRQTEWMRATAAGLLAPRGREHRARFQRFDAERPNLRVVVQRLADAGDAATAARLVRDAFIYLAHRDAEVEAVAWLDQLLARADAASATRGRLLVVRALAATVFADFVGARSLVAEGRPLLPDDADHGYDRALAATTDAYLAAADDNTQASRLIDDAAACLAALGAGLGRAYMEVTGGNLALHRGDLEAAERRYATAVELAEHLGDDAMLGRALSLLGLTRLSRGDVERARVSVIEGAKANRRGGQSTSMAYSLDGLAAVALAEGQPLVAAHALASAATTRQRVGHPPARAFVPVLDDLAARSRAALGDEAYEAASSEAQLWRIVEALDRALEALEQPPTATGAAAGAAAR